MRRRKRNKNPLRKLYLMKYAIFFLCCTFGFLNVHAQPPQKSDTGYVEHMPVAGYNLNHYLSQNLKYPNSARRKGIEGRVIVRFIVTETGEIDGVKIVKGIDKKCDEEAVRVVSNMPNWQPGTQNGKAVKVYFNLPINFKLEDDMQDMGAQKKKKGLPR